MIRHLLLVVFFSCLPRMALAEKLEILLIDPAHSQTADTLESILSSIPDAEVHKVDITELRKSPAPKSGVVVWLSPEPTLYVAEAAERWRSIAGNKDIGLMIVGLPHDEAGLTAMLAALRARGEVSAGPVLNKRLSGSSWIWTSGKPKDQSTIHLRKKFQLTSIPHRAWMQISADNGCFIRLNNKDVGQADEWRRPTSFDVTSLLHVGENSITITAHNDDGPAGIIASMAGTSDAGQELFRIVSDSSWEASADGRTWEPCQAIARLGGGDWEDKVQIEFSSDEYAISSDAPDAKQPVTLGRCVVLRGFDDVKRHDRNSLTPIAWAGGVCAGIATDGPDGRMVLFSGEPERTAEEGTTASVLKSDAFADLIASRVRWLAHRSAQSSDSGRHPPSSMPATPRMIKEGFPVTMQLSPIPYEGVAYEIRLPDSPAALRRMVDNLIDHGATLLQCPLPLPEKLAAEIEGYAQSRGMGITYYFERPIELFGRDKPPGISLYSAAYEEAVKKKVATAAAELSRYPRLKNGFLFQDEPFHAGESSFGQSNEEKAEFRKHYGYPLPLTLSDAARDPKAWLDTLNFRSDYFPIGWKTVYRLLKQALPNVQFILNHDSHNVFGGAVGQEGKLNIDDVFHWGGDFADIFGFDIYPYLMKDFRYGPNRTLKLTRMSQMNYALAQMRNLTQSSGKTMGFWFGTYNPEWYSLTEEGRKQFWMEREMIFTAVAGGADYLISGLGVPIDARHWDDVGDALRILHKASPAILQTRPIKARAAMLFPRTQWLQLQEEYWNVGQSFELFQRAFGELDVIHEEQIAKDGVGDYRILVLFDVKLLPTSVTKQIETFVSNGGFIVADCVPNLDELKRPADAMAKLFGVRDAATDRILWPAKMTAEVETDQPVSAPLPATTRPTDSAAGEALGAKFGFPIVSPRPCVITDGKVILETANHAPAIVRHDTGKGRAYLLGFCLQDTSFEARRSGDARSVLELATLLQAVTVDADVGPHIHSSNPDVAAAVRCNDQQAFMLLISHEALEPSTSVTARDLPFAPAHVIDIESGRDVSFTREGNSITIEASMPAGSTRILSVTP